MKEYEIIVKYKVKAQNQDEAFEILAKYQANTLFYTEQKLKERLGSNVVLVIDCDIEEMEDQNASTISQTQIPL